MLLVVCPNLAIDRILQVRNFTPEHVQRSKPGITQPGGKGSNVARVFRQLGSDVVLVGFLGRRNQKEVTEPLRKMGIHVDAIPAYEETRTCTIVCDPDSGSHPTVINEESPEVGEDARKNLLKTLDKWLPRVDAVLTTGSLSMGLPPSLYAEILDRARSQRKIAAIDATGIALRTALNVRPDFMKPNTTELRELLGASVVSMFPPHTALTFGPAGALVVHEGTCLFAPPPRISHINPIGSGDAFVAGYLKRLIEGRPASDCLRLALAAAASDAGTLRPGFVQHSEIRSLQSAVELRFSSRIEL